MPSTALHSGCQGSTPWLILVLSPKVLERLRSWLHEERVTDVVMESTGSYWIPVFNLLEGHVRVVLANPEEVKNRKGHKTDRKDAEHLADLLRHNHVKPSYIPAEPVRQLRDLTRRRVQLTQDATRERVQKLLEQVNVKIGSVLTDVFGVSGLHMLLALLDGRATPEEIAGLARGSAKRKTPQLIEAIQGNRMSDHVRFVIRGCLRHLACLEEEVEELDAEILRRMQLSTFQKAFTLLQTIPGVGQLSAATILAETGPDLDSFPPTGRGYHPQPDLRGRLSRLFVWVSPGAQPASSTGCVVVRAPEEEGELRSGCRHPRIFR